MCGRFTQRKEASKAAKRYSASENAIVATPRYNIAPQQMVLAVNQDHELVLLKWGLIPGWAKDAKIANNLINARADSIFCR